MTRQYCSCPGIVHLAEVLQQDLLIFPPPMEVTDTESLLVSQTPLHLVVTNSIQKRNTHKISDLGI
jgi:hypothetical protein